MDAHVVITRAEARARGLPRYFTGVPCGHGHLSERYVKGSVCLACNSKFSSAANAKRNAKRNADPNVQRKRQERAAAREAAQRARAAAQEATRRERNERKTAADKTRAERHARSAVALEIKAKREEAERRKARLPVIARVCREIARRKAAAAIDHMPVTAPVEPDDIDWSDLPPYVPKEPLSDYWFEFIFGYKREDAEKVMRERVRQRDPHRRKQRRLIATAA